MKKQNKITLSAVLAGLASAFMLLSRIPNLTYAVPALSGLFIMIVLFEAGARYAFLGFVCSAFLNFLFADINSAVLFLLLLGYYPILKAGFDKISKKAVQWLLKVIVFNSSVAGCFFAFKLIIGLAINDLYIWGRYTVVLLVVILNAVFVLYDIALSQTATFYFSRIRPKISKFLK